MWAPLEAMAVVVDQDQQWLVNCLTATLDPAGDVRSFAEASLNQASLRPGFGFALSKVAANRELSFGLRQLAAVLLKQFIKKHWKEEDESFEHPVVAREEKEMIRGLLMASLDDSHRKICTAISMAIASIAVHDWPEDWPDLLPFLLKLISDQGNRSGVNGALKCLALISGDLDDRMVPSLIPVLFPCLLAIVSASETYDKNLRAKALSIVYACTYMLGAMSGVYKTEVHALMTPMLKSWMAVFSTILKEPVHPEEPDDWSMRMEVLKCMNQFVQNFQSLVENEFMVVMGPLWQTFMTSFKVYVRASIEGVEDAFEGRYDSDGEDKSLDSFVIQLVEFLLTVVGNSKIKAVVRTNIKELAYYTIGFLQITEQQVHTWSTDANQFVADEEDVTYSCRISGVLLLEEVVNSFGEEGIIAIVDSVKARFYESQQEKETSSNTWWRMREAALFALASLSDQLLEAEDSGFTGISLGNLVEQMVTEDIGTSVHDYPFLFARLFASVAKFSSVVSHGVLEHYLKAAVKTIGMDVPPPVKIGACRTLSQLLPDANILVIQPEILCLLTSLSDLLYQISDETLHLVLETLQTAITAGHKAGVSVEAVISPVILNLWSMHVSDPFVIIDIIDVLESSADITTRSKSKIVPDQWTVIPLPAKIVALLADALIETEEQAHLPDEEESEWEEIEEGAMEPGRSNSFLYSAAAPSHGRTTYDQLEALAKAFNENEEDEDDDDLLCAADPLNEMNLASYLADFFVKFSQKDRQWLDHLCQGLSRVQQKAIHKVVKCGGS